MNPLPLPFQIADPAKLRQEMARAGLHHIRVKTINEELRFRFADHKWAWVTNSHSIGAGMVAGITREQEAAARRAVEEMLHERAAGNGPAVLNNPTHIAVGTK